MQHGMQGPQSGAFLVYCGESCTHMCDNLVLGMYDFLRAYPRCAICRLNLWAHGSIQR